MEAGAHNVNQTQKDKYHIFLTHMRKRIGKERWVRVVPGCLDLIGIFIDHTEYVQLICVNKNNFKGQAQ
jgi:hypothetical protein